MICYDIDDDSTRRRAEKLLLNHTRRVQESVFEGYFTSLQLQHLRNALTQEIDNTTDSLRFYPLCSWCSKTMHWQGTGMRTEDAAYYVV